MQAFTIKERVAKTDAHEGDTIMYLSVQKATTLVQTFIQQWTNQTHEAQYKTCSDLNSCISQTC